MTREEAIERLYELQFYSACKADERASMADIWREYVASIDMAISALREQESAKNAHCNCCKKGNSWIPVTERLPEKYTLVLCYKDGRRRLGYYLGAEYGKGVAAFRHPNDQFAFGVTHWMPLPEPPKEEV